MNYLFLFNVQKREVKKDKKRKIMKNILKYMIKLQPMIIFIATCYLNLYIKG